MAVEVVQEQYTDQERQDITQALGQYPADSHATLFSYALSGLIQRQGRFYPSEVEVLLRESNLRPHLVAVPWRVKVSTPTEVVTKAVISRLPQTGERNYPFWAAICIHGEREAAKLLTEFGKTPEQNIQDLKRAGLPIFSSVKIRKLKH